MASTLKVDTIQNAAGADLLVNGYPRRPGQVIEYLANICDGGPFSGESGTYSTTVVTSRQVTTTTYSDIIGSSITYAPPPGTSRVIYRYTFASQWLGGTAHSIQHYKFFIDNNEVLFARHNRSATYYEQRAEFEWIIPIGGVSDTNTGRQETWTTPKTLKMQTRRYAGNSQDLNDTYYWDGTTSSVISMPMLTIIAIA
jgi:hypothetical protein